MKKTKLNQIIKEELSKVLKDNLKESQTGDFLINKKKLNDNLTDDLLDSMLFLSNYYSNDYVGPGLKKTYNDLKNIKQLLLKLQPRR
jgi:uncharacterized protein YihD (DUF1040 family)